MAPLLFKPITFVTHLDWALEERILISGLYLSVIPVTWSVTLAAMKQIGGEEKESTPSIGQSIHTRSGLMNQNSHTKIFRELGNGKREREGGEINKESILELLDEIERTIDNSGSDGMNQQFFLALQQERATLHVALSNYDIADKLTELQKLLVDLS